VDRPVLPPALSAREPVPWPVPVQLPRRQDYPPHQVSPSPLLYAVLIHGKNHKAAGYSRLKDRETQGYAGQKIVMARILEVFHDGGEGAVLAAAATADGRWPPATVGRSEPGPYQVA